MVCEVWGIRMLEGAQQGTGGANRSEESQAKVCKAHAAPPGPCENFDQRAQDIGESAVTDRHQSRLM